MSLIKTNDLSMEKPNGVQFDVLPAEIKQLVFQNLDYNTFFKCREVSKGWKGVIDSIKDDAVWKRFLYNLYSTKYECYIKSTNIRYYTLFYNLFTWNTPIELVVNGFHESNYHIEKIHVYRDNVILVYENNIKYFKVDDLYKEVRVYEGCFSDFNENDHMFLAIDHRKKLSLHGKKNQNSHLSCDKDVFMCEGRKIVAFQLVGKSIYYVTSQSVWKSTWESNKWTRKFLAKNQTNAVICGLNVYGEDVYLVSTFFKVYKVSKEMSIIEVYTSPISGAVTRPYIFDRCSVAYAIGVESREVVDLRNAENMPYLVLGQKNLSCLLEHGDIIITAYSSGIIDIFSIKEAKEYGIYIPMRVSTRPYIKDVKAMEIYEGVDGHYLYIVSNSSLLVYRFIIPERNGKSLVPVKRRRQRRKRPTRAYYTTVMSHIHRMFHT